MVLGTVVDFNLRELRGLNYIVCYIFAIKALGVRFL